MWSTAVQLELYMNLPDKEIEENMHFCTQSNIYFSL